jgi:hypothetical protein
VKAIPHFAAWSGDAVDETVRIDRQSDCPARPAGPSQVLCIVVPCRRTLAAQGRGRVSWWQSAASKSRSGPQLTWSAFATHEAERVAVHLRLALGASFGDAAVDGDVESECRDAHSRAKARPVRKDEEADVDRLSGRRSGAGERAVRCGLRAVLGLPAQLLGRVPAPARVGHARVAGGSVEATGVEHRRGELDDGREGRVCERPR